MMLGGSMTARIRDQLIGGRERYGEPRLCQTPTFAPPYLTALSEASRSTCEGND